MHAELFPPDFRRDVIPDRDRVVVRRGGEPDLAVAPTAGPARQDRLELTKVAEPFESDNPRTRR